MLNVLSLPDLNQITEIRLVDEGNEPVVVALLKDGTQVEIERRHAFGLLESLARRARAGPNRPLSAGARPATFSRNQGLFLESRGGDLL